MKLNNLNRVYKLLEKNFKDNKLEENERYIHNVRAYIYYVGMILLELRIINDLYDKEIYSEIFEINVSNFINNEYLIIYKNEKENIKSILSSLSIKEISDFDLGKIYENIIPSKLKKELGQVYTPNHIIKEMIDSSITEKHIIDNPYFKVIDPACGGGYFLIHTYKKIHEILISNKDIIIQKHPNLKFEIYNDIAKFILNNIYGADIDEFSIFMTKVSLLLKLENLVHLNLYNINILLDKDIKIKFDLVIGNPPYIGHKKIDKDYKEKLKENYSEVYKDKADISYCFFKKGYELLKDNGKLIFITSRYFLEAPSAIGLREYITKNYNIKIIIDFYGFKVFKGIGISPVIVNINKGCNSKNIISVLRANHKSNKNTINFKNYKINQCNLEKNGWILINDNEKKLYDKIHSHGEITLDDICEFNQGIITGLDKAFIVNNSDIENLNLEKDIVKPWVKNSNIKKYEDIFISKYILYSNDIDDLTKYKNSIKYISMFKNKLLQRRECKKNIIKWYELQWGRNLSVFKSPKIIFPYKASESEFTIDYKNLLCSADVYIIKVKDIYKNKISLEYLLGFLNSSLFEFYFKAIAKKVGEKLYEYYPNKICTLKIKNDIHSKLVDECVLKIIMLNQKLNNKDIYDKQDIINSIEYEKTKINDFFYNLYDLRDEEISVIKSICKK